MALGEGEAQEVAAARDPGDGLAGEDDGAARERHGERAARDGRDHVALAALLGDDRAVGLAAGDLVDEHVQLGLQLIDPLLRDGAAGEELLRPLEIGLDVVALRLERAQARLRRLHLQRELLVDDAREHGAGLDRGAFLHVDRNERSPDPRPRRHQVARLDAAVDRLHVGDLVSRRYDFRRIGRFPSERCRRSRQSGGKDGDANPTCGAACG